MNEDYLIMWLSRLPNLGAKRIRALLDVFDSAEEIWNAPAKILHHVSGMTEESVNSILNLSHRRALKNMSDELEKGNIRFVSFKNPEYPRLLLETDTPPTGIYIKGELPDERNSFFSIIGARRCSHYGLSMAYKFAGDLAKEKVVIVSGMAKGIDSMAHRGAIDAGGKTIAVLGFGHNHCYPAENRGLMEEIAKNGCLISEYPPDTPAAPYNFPQRNRIISGLSQGLLVVEAGKKSGTLITVDFALNSGRNVFVLPANITNRTSEGTNELIKQGCPIATCAEDILDDLNIAAEEKTEKKEEPKNKSVASDEKQVYDFISLEPKSVDEIAQNFSYTVQDIQYIITILELNGLIRKIPGGKYEAF